MRLDRFALRPSRFAQGLRVLLLHLHAESMTYAILRTAKLKSFGEIGGSLAHTYRTRHTPNADPARAHLNEHQGPGSAVAVREAIRARLPDRRRSDAVLCIEYFVGASPEFFQGGEDGQDYFKRASRWLKERHGADNVIAVSVHRDETSPHLVAYVVPLDEQGKLNAKSFLGGRTKLSAMQTEFAEKVGRPYGLERGIEGSKATHTTIRQYYAALDNSDFKHGRVTPKALEPRVLEKRLLTTTVESREQVAERLTMVVQSHYSPAMTLAGTASIDKRRAQEMARTAKEKDEALKAALRQLEVERARAVELSARFIDGLTEEQQNVLSVKAADQRRENWIAAEARRRAANLLDLAKRATGALLIFARKGVVAIDAAGSWKAVQWEEVERSAIRESITKNHSYYDAMQACLEYSPGQVSTDPDQADEALKLAAARDAFPKPRLPAKVAQHGEPGCSA